MVDAAARRTTVLLFGVPDTDADLILAMLRQAAPGEFEVARADTLAEATTYLETTPASVVLLDLGSADMGGLEIVGTLTTRSPGGAVIVLGRGQDDDLGVAAIAAGAGDCLSMPTLEAGRLVRAIRFAIVRKRMETSLGEAQSIARVGSWEMDIATRRVSCSRELYRLFEFRLDQKPTFQALIDRTHPEDKETSRQAVRTTMQEFTPFLIEHRLLLPDGSVRWVRARGRIELDSAGRPGRLLGTAQDITEQKLADDGLQYQAFHDSLSGLPNRLLFLERMSQALKGMGQRPSTVAVIYLDIDRFKVINDSLGRDAGDQLLVAMATRLKGFVRPGDTVARISGDEFAVLCESISGEAEAVSVAARICAAMTDPLSCDCGDFVVSVSAGIALATDASVQPDSMLRDADAAMYKAKSEGRARSAVFSESMRTKAIGRLDIEMSLRRSIINGDLRLFYQPIVAVADGRVVGHEALVRWAHPERGLLTPDHFIAIAEETGLIVPLGAWVLREACLQAKRFQSRDAMWARLTMSVNLSGGQLGQPDLVELVASALHRADLRPADLQLEMTESVLMDDAATTITILQRLKGLGVRLGVDDFGTGYSSLAYLKRFPVDVLKIDRSFVSGLGQDPGDSALVAAVVSLADALGLTAVAEGVETDLQRSCLVSLGCGRAQGYLFARPVGASESEQALDHAALRWSEGHAQLEVYRPVSAR